MPLIINWVIGQWIVPIVSASGIPLLPCSYAYCRDLHGNSWIVNLWGVLSEQNVNRSQSTEIHESLICEATWITTSTKNPKTPTKNCTTHTIPPCLDAKLFYIYKHVLLMPLIINWVIGQWIVPIVFASGIPLLPCSYAYCRDLHGNSWIVNLWGVLSEQNVNRFPIHGNSWIINLWGVLSEQNVNRSQSTEIHESLICEACYYSR
jgi:hypothetical protein